MSTFGGRIREYKRISIDRFDGINLNSTAFFLSHCHRDHMHGLSSTAFKARLRARPDAKLYVSDVSRQLLLNEPKYAWLERHTIALPLDCPNTVTVPTNGDDHGPDYELVVTPISAEHCAGSVMFLLEGDCGRVLYTGDFRLAVGDSEHLTALHEPSGAVKNIRCAYVDTTLCTPEAAYVPSREDSVAALITLSKPTILAGGFLRLALPGAQLGYEGLFAALSARFAMPVHVTRSQMSRYAGLTDVEGTLTTDGRRTRIHAGCGCELGSPCVTVKPSAMWFAHRVGPSGLVERIGEDWYRLCYSTHASLAEVRDLVKHLQPEMVCANVRLPGVDVVSLVWAEKRLAVKEGTDHAAELVTTWTTEQTVEKSADETMDGVLKQTIIQEPKGLVEHVMDPTPSQRIGWMGVHTMKQTTEQGMDQTMKQVVIETVEQTSPVDQMTRGTAKNEMTDQAAGLVWNFWGSGSEEDDAELCLPDLPSALQTSQKDALQQTMDRPVDQVVGQALRPASGLLTQLPKEEMANQVVDHLTKRSGPSDNNTYRWNDGSRGRSLCGTFRGSDSSDSNVK
uniref:Protein artemis n=1 Tax=Ixodes ricinus TaxID=34613 RepID=A0A090XEG6_IXORI